MSSNNKLKKLLGSGTSKQQTLVEGAVILTLGIALVKLIGAIVKIPLANIIGEAGMGYYSSAYNLYLPFFTLASGGFPAALSRQVSENMTLGRYKDAEKVRIVARNTFLITGTICFIGMVIAGIALTGNGYYNSKAIYAILAMCPSVFFCCVMGAYRGYNEGLRNMIPTALSQIIEALGKLFIGFTAALIVVKSAENKFLEASSLIGGAAAAAEEGVMIFGTECHSLNEALNASYPFAAAGALAGITLGSAAALLYLMIRYRTQGSGITKEQLKKAPAPQETKVIFKKFLEIGIPIALGVLAINLTQLIDSLTVQSQISNLDANGLRNIYGDYIANQPDEDIPNFLWGVYNNGLTLYNLVPYLTQAFGTSALPALAAAWIIKDREKIAESITSVLKLGVLIAFPAGVGICALSNPILKMLYPEATAGICPPMLRVLGIMALFGAMAGPVNSMLQAVGKQMVPVKLMCIGAVIKLVLNYTLVGVESINIKGAPIGSLACYVFIVVSSVVILCKTAEIKLDIMSTFIRPLAAAVLCGLSAWGVQTVLNLITDSRIVTVLAIGVAVVVYIISLLALKAVSKSDLLLIPKGEKLAKILEKRGWIV